MEKSFNPLIDEVPKEIPLQNAPLVRVIGQIRFPDTEIINDTQGIIPLQQKIKSQFPILKSEKFEAVQFTPEGPRQGGAARFIRRFSSADENSRLSLAPDFLAFETTKYSSRSDFISQLVTLYSEVNKVIGIPLVTRIGIRYIDRIELDNTFDISELVKEQILGVIASNIGGAASLAIQDSVFQIPLIDASMRARWGVVPQNATIDPSAIESLQVPSWILDIDTFSNTKQQFSTEKLEERFFQLAERSYSMFRWVVSDAFLKKFGGKV